MQYLFMFPQFPFAVQIANAFEPGNNYFQVPVGVAWFFSVILAPCYFFLHMYLESILPNTFGVSKTCCFCLRGRRQQEDIDEEARQSLLRNKEDGTFNSTIGDEEAAAFEKADASQRLIDPDHAIQLRRLTKMFGDFTAVDKLSLSIDRGEVFSILGHNGAGKTTAIYMLTGMYDPTGGEGTVDGYSIRNDIDEVRKQLGLCQ